MIIVIAFHISHQRDYKNDCPTLLSYTRFLEVMQSVLIPLSYFLLM